jgi:aconitate hydratase
MLSVNDDRYRLHTVNAGGLGMVAIGVGGADAVDVMSGMAN